MGCWWHSERGLEWRCSDSLSLREFLRLESRDRVPDHSWLSRTRARLPHEVHTAIFDWVLALIAEAGLVKGERIGVDASTMEANAALRNKTNGLLVARVIAPANRPNPNMTPSMVEMDIDRTPWPLAVLLVSSQSATIHHFVGSLKSRLGVVSVALTMPARAPPSCRTRVSRVRHMRSAVSRRRVRRLRRRRAPRP